MRSHAKLNITRLITVILTLLLLSVQWMPAVSAAESGTCGSELSWTFDAGTLTITGKGDMSDFNDLNLPPWDAFRYDIRRVVFPDGLTSVGNRAFYDCKNLTTVILPDTVKEIGVYSFASCTALSMLSFGARVEVIDDGAFHSCSQLDAVRLPYGLKKLGDMAFYRCESLSAITIYPDLTEMGSSVFAYCENLITVTNLARIQTLPEWTFYGCDRLSNVVIADTVSDVGKLAFWECTSLSTVYYGGDEEDAEAIKNEIAEDVPGFDVYGYVAEGEPSNITNSGSLVNNDDGTVSRENITVQQDDDVTVVTKVDLTRPADSETGGNYSAQITVTVENKNGWADAADAVKDSLKSVNDSYANKADSDTIDVTVYMKDTDTPEGKFVQELAGRDLDLTVVAHDGSSWKFDCSTLTQDDLDGNYNLSYTISKASKESCKKLGTDDAYALQFANSTAIKAEVLIQLPSPSSSCSNAFLYQIEQDGTHTRLQAVMVDQNAVAHFYLASIDKDTQYVIGLNVPNESTDDLIIPNELSAQYNNAIARLEKIEYVVTGVNSSWGMSFWQVTLILVGVLVVCVIAVGIVIGVMSKRKYKKQASLSKT